MKQTSLRIFLALTVLAAVVLGTSALATTTWTSKSGGDFPSATAVTTTGTEAAPTLATQGFDLNGLAGFTVHLESIANGDGGVMNFSAGTLLGYLYNPVSGVWNRASELDLVVAAGVPTAAYTGFSVSNPNGRVAWVPSGVGVAVKVYIEGTRAR